MESKPKKLSAIPILGIALITVLAYAGGLEAPLLAPEVRALEANPAIVDFSRINDIVRVDQIFNRSMPKVSFALNHLAGQMEPAGYRLVNLLIHLLVGLALYWVVHVWLALFEVDNLHYTKWVPLVTAGLHLLHPLNSQAVILTPSRPTLLASLFYLLTFGFLSKFLQVYRDNPARAKGSLDLLLVMACLALGGTCDPVMVTVPFMAWIFYRFYIPSQRIEVELFGLALVPWVIYLIYQFTNPDPALRAEAVGKTGGVTLLYLLSEIKAFMFYYLPKALAPMHLSIDPGLTMVKGLGDWTWMLALAGLVALGLLIRATRSRLALWASLWTLLIFFCFYSLGMDDPVASEPRFYLPGMGVHLLLAMALVALGIRHPIAAWLRFGVPTLFLILTFTRVQDYRSELQLWEETVRASPHKPRVHYQLARAYLGAGKTDEAERQLLTTLELDPKFNRAHINMGEIYLKRKDYSKALDSFNALMDQGIKDPALLFLAGETHLNLKQPDKAIPLLEVAVEKVPGSATGRNLLARAYKQSGQLKKAEREYRTSLKIDPNQPVTHNELGLVFWEQKSFYFADSSFQKAYQLDNRYTEALNNLVSSNMLFHDYEQAKVYLHRLLEINPDDENARQMLTAAERLLKQQKEKPPAPSPSPH